MATQLFMMEVDMSIENGWDTEQTVIHPGRADRILKLIAEKEVVFRDANFW